MEAYFIENKRQTYVLRDGSKPREMSGLRGKRQRLAGKLGHI